MISRFLPLLAAGLCLAQSYTPGPQVLTFLSDVDDSDQPYALYLPKGYDPARAYPLVVSLHGAGSNHRLNLRRVFGRGNQPMESDAQATRYFPAFREVEYIVASPYARGTMGYQGIPEKDVWDMLADVKRRFRIDEDRVYLTGLSMGGGGTLWLGLTRPDLWAAIAPVCAAAPRGAEELAGNALNVPVHLFHGDQDPAVKVDSSRSWHKRFLDLGVRAEYVEYPGVRHNSWDLAYKDAAIFTWFGQFRRQPFPERVRFTTRAYAYDSAYWVRIDGLTPGEAASIDARFTAGNRIQVTAEGVDGITFSLAGHPRFAAGAPLVVTLGGQTLRHKGATASFRRTAKGWAAGKYEPPAGSKRPGAEGPLVAAVAGRHMYVYGTADDPPEDELQRRREVAAAAAEWSTLGRRLMLNLPVKADKDVTPAEAEGGNLVLFGTRQTNSLIAKFAPSLPLELNAGAADYGLVFVAPVGKHYVVVNSGLPWWTGAHGRSALPWRVLQGSGDFTLFKGSLDHIVAQGRFDRDWKTPPDAAAKMKESGTVVVR